MVPGEGVSGGGRAALARAFHAADRGDEAIEPTPIAVSAADLVKIECPPLEPLLVNWLFQKMIVMIHAWRGLGKTQLALAIAWAVATGGKYLCWEAPKPRKVLYLDGEMPVQLMQQRIRDLASMHGEVPDRLCIATPDLQEQPMPDLATLGGQASVNRLIDIYECELIIIDNLSSLARCGAENEAESWASIAAWSLALRRQNITTVFIHHSGKSGKQRGTSKREDLLDVVLGLRRPPDYREEEGAVFEIHFEKARSLVGDELAPIEAKLQRLPNGALEWTHRLVDTAAHDQIISLWNGGAVTITDIAHEIGKHKSSVHRTLKAAQDGGFLSRAYPSVKRNQRNQP